MEPKFPAEVSQLGHPSGTQRSISVESCSAPLQGSSTGTVRRGRHEIAACQFDPKDAVVHGCVESELKAGTPTCEQLTHAATSTGLRLLNEEREMRRPSCFCSVTVQDGLRRPRPTTSLLINLGRAALPVRSRGSLRFRGRSEFDSRCRSSRTRPARGFGFR